MRQPLVAANWKMHGSLAFVADFAERLSAALAIPQDVDGDSEFDLSSVDVVVFPPALYLQAWYAQARNVECGIQDLGISPSGAHTGEIAAEMVTDVGGRWAILGHSERRIDQDEKDDLVATKVGAALRAGLRPIVCVGETLAEREAGHEIAVVERQLEAVFDRIDIAGLAQGAVAYEPVWAIGTGQTATPEQAQDMHAFIRDKIAHEDSALAADVRVLYGGSVKPDNAAELFGQRDIDGGLVGGAALDVDQFVEIIRQAAASVA